MEWKGRAGSCGGHRQTLCVERMHFQHFGSGLCACEHLCLWFCAEVQVGGGVKIRLLESPLNGGQGLWALLNSIVWAAICLTCPCVHPHAMQRARVWVPQWGTYP